MSLLLLLACSSGEPAHVKTPAAAAPKPAAAPAPAPSAPAASTASTARARTGAAGTVDIYVPTGPRNAPTGCDSGENSLCEIWHLQLVPGESKPVKVEKVVPAGNLGGRSSGQVEVALSPDETRLAWLERNFSGSRIQVMTLPDGKPHTIIAPEALQGEGSGRSRAEWPEWARDDLLLFDAATTNERGLELKTVYSVPLKDPARPGAFVRQLGDLGKDNNHLGVHDVAVYRGAGPLKAVAFGPVPGQGKLDLAPRVETLDDEGAPVGTASVFDLGSNASGEHISECHHPAWNYAGTQIMCMVHDPSEIVDGIPMRLLYAYSQVDGKWGSPKRVFEPIPVDKAPIAAAKLFTPRDYQHLSFKYAQWCGSDDWVIGTVFSSNKSQTRKGEDPIASRVMLIRTNPVEYYDLTEMIEANQHQPLGSLYSFTGTCGRLK